ncbi:RNA polymerase subunit sigma-70 [Alkalispirochaeta sphaeroplastigenens]|uniref:RNA polymerase subunit sigma-70 n=1 Tax=Alkalispirochaeta sphaeroplastigenens TaxID=1187066 RepID=A0A2S4K1K3_9SPIO|nr:sigma-70 family RNA polymerase sigma factor [Alkalispirochaeta sphaeroplastigenens]POR05641.1 RNA polymerase subunit sigma-70 [Alkalispirochaeta sphaeroplastigenens]
MAKKISADYSQNDALQTYYTQIRKNALLTAEEEWELSRRIEQGDAEAKRILVEHNLRLVVKIAKAYVTHDTSLLDLIQDGNLGLLKAASRFDYRKGVRFSTYASWWIKQSLSRSLANRRRTIRLPHRKEDVLKRIQRAYNYLNQHLMRTPSVEEIAREAHISPEDVSEIMNIAAVPVSLDTEINDENSTVMDLLEDDTFSPDVQVMDRILREETIKGLKILQDRERQVIWYRYALDGGERYTLKRVSATMGISPETVRQIEMKAIRKLRDQAGHLREMLTN